MRLTLNAWWCGCGIRNEAHNKMCLGCKSKRIEKHAQIHPADRAVIFYNPATGERRTPPRADAPMPQHYAEQGFERQEIMSMTAFEKQTGLVHEASNYSSGNEDNGNKAVHLPAINKTAKEAAIKVFAEGLASGPLTGVDKFLEG